MPTSRRLTQWVLLCALVFAVVGMHHVAAAESPHAAHSVSHEDQPQEHDALHLCLAVLVAAAALFVALFALRTPLPQVAAPRFTTWLTAPRRPPPGGRSLLTTLCVLRH